MKLISYSEAKERGLPAYFTGKPCPKGHISARSIHNRCCLACHKERQKALHKSRYTDPAIREENRKRVRDWRLANQERYDANQKRYRQENRERLSKVAADWNDKHPERAKASREARNTRRRTRKKENGGHCTPDDIIALRERQRGRCAGCLKKSRSLEIDHIQPVSRGGKSDPANLQLLCAHCNRTKHAKDPIEWAQDNGRLL
jgi:5-methylcytosine-specific restriction endonuclease McrA